MNTILTSLFSRKSVRAYTDREITEEQKNLIFESALQAPTAGNQTLYTMLEISDPGIKKSLSVLCDNQPFINPGDHGRTKKPYFLNLRFRLRPQETRRCIRCSR